MSFIIEVLHLTLCSIILKINTQLTMLRFEKKKESLHRKQNSLNFNVTKKWKISRYIESNLCSKHCLRFNICILNVID